MQFVDIWAMFPFIIAITFFIIILALAVLKNMLAQNRIDAGFRYYTDRMLPLLLEHAILLHYVMRLVNVIVPVEDLEVIRDSIESWIYQSQNVVPGGPKPDKVTLEWVNGLVKTNWDFFEKIVALSPKTDQGEIDTAKSDPD